MRKLFTKTLKEFKSVKYSDAALELLLGTCATESSYGKYTVQFNDGPARGIMQIEPATAKDLFVNYLHYRQDMLNEVLNYVICKETFNWESLDQLKHELQINREFSIIVARLCYYRAPAKLPEHFDVEGLAKYWKKYYNTELGKGKVSHFINAYNNYAKHDKE